jgi:hypothetical protein
LLAALAVLMAAVWRRSGLTGFEAAAAGAAMVTLPPFQLFVGTAAMGAVLPAMLVAIGAALLADGEAGREGGPRAGRLAAASLLVLAALATYQPSGLFFCVVVAVLLIAPDPPPRMLQRKLLIMAGTAMPAMMGAFAIFLAGRSAFPAELIDIAAPRAMLALDPVGKAEWFLTLPLPHALNLWKLWPSLAFAMVMVIIVAAGIGLHVRGRKDAWLRAALAIALVPVCYLPNLVIAEDRSSFRSQPALAAIVFVYIVIVLLGQFTGSRRWIAHTMLAAGVVAGAASASRNVVALIASPQARELALARETIAGLTRDGGSSTLPRTTDPAAQPPGARLVGIVPSDYRDSLAPVVLYDEFGYPSTALPWSVYTLTWLVLAERMEGDTAAFHVTDARDAAVVPDTVIDWGEVLRAGR